MRSLLGFDRQAKLRLKATAITLVAFAWRAQDLVQQSLWRDEVDAICFALGDIQNTLSMFVDAGQNGALYFLALRVWLRLVGSSEFALRYPAVLFGTLSVPLIWLVARKLIPANQGTSSNSRKWHWLLLATIGSPPILAALFLALNPYQFWYSQDGKMYALVVFLALLAVWFWLLGIGRGGWFPWLGFLLTVTVAIYTHLLMVLLIPLFFLWFLIAWPQSREHLRGFVIAMAGLTLPYLPLLWWQWDMLTATRQLTALDFIPLPDMVESLLLEHIVGITRPDNRLWLAPILMVALAGLLAGYQVISSTVGDLLQKLTVLRRHLLIVSWLMVPVFGIFLLSLRQPVYLPRYVIWIAPAAMMLIASGIHLVWSYQARWAQPTAALLTLYLILFWSFVGWQEKTATYKHDLRGAVTYITQHRQPDDLLILQIPHLEYAYRYYSGDKGPYPFKDSDKRLGWWTAGPMTNNLLGKQEARHQVDLEMRKITNGATDIWIMLSEASLWDERELMIKWLSQYASLIDSADFYGAKVRLYRVE